MRVAGRFARHRPQPEALGRVERSAFDSAVVEGDALRLAVFEIQLAVIHAGKRLPDDPLDAARVHAGALEEQFVGHCKIGHWRLRPWVSTWVAQKGRAAAPLLAIWASIRRDGRRDGDPQFSSLPALFRL